MPNNIDELVQLASQPAPSSNVDELVSMASSPAPEQPTKKEIKTIDKLKAHANAAYLGALDFIGGMANIGAEMAPQLIPGAGSIAKKAADVGKKNVKSQYTGAEKRYKQAQAEDIGGLGISRLAGSVAATAGLPAAGFGAAAKIPSMLGRLGAYAGQGAATGAAFGAMQYDPNNKLPVNLPGAAMGAAGGAVLGPAFGAASKYASNVKEFAKAKAGAFGAKVFGRDLKDPNHRFFSDLWDSVPIIGTRAQRMKQEKTFPNAIQNFIKTISKDVGEKANYKDSEKIIESTFNKAYTRLKDKEANLWNSVSSKDKININLSSAKELANKFANDSVETGIPNKVTKLLSRKVSSFDDLKELRTAIRNQKDAIAKKMATGNADRGDYQNIKALYDDLTDKMMSAADKKGLGEAFARANEYTKNLNGMFEDGGMQMKKAIKDNAMAYNFFNKLISEKNPTQVERMIKPFNKDELSVLRAGFIRKSLDDSLTETGKFNVSKFIERVSAEQNADILMGDTYKALKGLDKIMRSNLQAKESGTGLRLATGSVVGTTIGGNIVGSAVTGNPALAAGTAGALLTAKALNAITGASPLKNTLIRISNMKSIDNDVGRMLIKRVGDLGRKAGYILTQEGIDKVENK